MYRKIYNELLVWKKQKDRQPLILSGARQVGKSYILSKFSKKEFNNTFVFNFEEDKTLNDIFKPDLYPKRILRDLSLLKKRTIDIDHDIIIFDEIQECPRALTSLKYFCEKMPNLAICCAGSLLGVKLSTESFPVGKVSFLNLYPMNFEEFLTSLNDEFILEAFNLSKNKKKNSSVAHNMLLSVLWEYYVTGGMPQAVKTYIENRENSVIAFKKVRNLQKNLLTSYMKDFAKHSGKTNSVHIVSVFENIPMQLSKSYEGSVKRFKFKDIIPGKKSYANLHGPIDWLTNAGLAINVNICNRAEIPLESFCKSNIFKLYLFDIGILGCMLDIPPNLIISQNFGISKGYFTENFVACEFLASFESKLYSWTEKNSEIEFLRLIDDNIIPIEVKAGQRTQAKSLNQYILKYSPLKAIKISSKPLSQGKNSVILNLPLYLAGSL